MRNPSILSEQNWEMIPVKLATLPAPEWECVMGKNETALRPLVFWLWILKSGKEVGIIDTGLPEAEELEALNQANQTLHPNCVFTLHATLEEALQSHGIAPEQVAFALISQWITYCTGGLVHRWLPRAHVYAAWEGMREFLLEDPGHPPARFYLTPESWEYVRELRIEKRLTFARESQEVRPGVWFDPTGGHHPGSAGVRVQTTRGVVGILETAFVQENIEGIVPIGIAENAAQCRDAIRHYRNCCDLVLAGHEPQADLLLGGWIRGETH